jgi:hypothetical protein
MRCRSAPSLPQAPGGVRGRSPRRTRGEGSGFGLHCAHRARQARRGSLAWAVRRAGPTRRGDRDSDSAPRRALARFRLSKFGLPGPPGRAVAPTRIDSDRLGPTRIDSDRMRVAVLPWRRPPPSPGLAVLKLKLGCRL